MSATDKNQIGDIRAKPNRKEVARLAGVSAATVSLVLNNRHAELRISDKTREKVLSAAREIGYNPNPLMQSILRGRTNTVSLCISREAWYSPNPYWMDLVQGVRDACSDYGLDLLVPHDRSDGDVRVGLSRIKGGLVDGVIINPIIDDIMAEGLAQSHVPTVAIGNVHPGLPCVLGDAEEGMKQIVAHLLALGHKTFAYINRNGVPVASEVTRRRSIHEKLAEHGLELPVSHEFRAHFPDEKCLEWFLSLNPRPSAVICFNDMRADQFIRRLAAAGIQVPSEVSVTGFDGNPVPESDLTITSYEVPVWTVYAKAVERLVQLINGEKLSSQTLVIPGRFIPGNTCAASSDL